MTKGIHKENKERIKAAPLFRRIRKHADKRIKFNENTSTEDKKEAYKEFVRLEEEMLLRYHKKGDGGLKVTMARAVLIDVLIQHLFDEALKIYYRKKALPPLEVSVIASGGYGRGELNLFSDIDLMFLFHDSASGDILREFQQVLIDEILYPLWDLGMKVGHSFRDSKAVMEECVANLATMNSLLEIRKITGSDSLFQSFKETFHSFFDKQDIRNNILQQIEERKRRHEKFSYTVFLQSSDIKNGPGGLRDYQTMLWMARAKYGTYHLSALVDKGVLSAADHKELIEAYDFLLKARNELHIQTGKPRDVLTLETQGNIATGLGYKQSDLLLRIEFFMRDYYKHAQKIFRVSKNIARLFRYEENKKYENKRFRNLFKKDPRRSRKKTDGFILGENQIYYEHRDIFVEDPIRMVRVFRIVQQTGLYLDFELRKLIQENKNLITPKVARNKQTTNIFLSILREVGNVYEILRLMHELEILGKVLPEFGGIEYMVQHEYYHRYTADVHVLNTIREADIVFHAKDPEGESFFKAINDTEDPARIYIMLLLHDLGKSMGIKDHAVNGIPIAKKICRRWGITGSVKEQICFIVQYHLEMARFWQKHDLDDPENIQNFAKFIKEPDTLRYLFVHNYCDSKGTTEGLWSDYKKLLHIQLFNSTMAILQDSSKVRQSRLSRIQAMRKKILAIASPEIPEEEVNAHFEAMPERYYVNISEQEILLHIQMVNRLLKSIQQSDSMGSLQPIFDWNTNLDAGTTTVNVVTWDRAGLFYKLAGALSVAGLNIMSTKAISRSDHISIDTFYVVESSSGISSSKAKALFADKVDKALMRNEDLWTDIKKTMKSKSSSLFKSDTEKLGINPHGSVNVYNEISMNKTIVEIQAVDNVGLLYQVGKTIFEHGFDISFARIATQNNMAIDTFYITPINGKVVKDEKLLFLKDSLDLILGMFKSIRDGDGK